MREPSSTDDASGIAPLNVWAAIVGVKGATHYPARFDADITDILTEMIATCAHMRCFEDVSALACFCMGNLLAPAALNPWSPAPVAVSTL